jgi:hypothetical protein
MSNITHVKFNNATELPIADGEYTTAILEDNSSLSHPYSFLAVAFYDVNDDIVTPSAGTVEAKMSPIKGQWLSPSSGDQLIDATLTGADATYTPPLFHGPALKGKIVFAGIAGASYAKAFFWRA